MRLQLVSRFNFALPIVKRGGRATQGLAELLDRLVALLELLESLLPKLELSLTGSSRHWSVLLAICIAEVHERNKPTPQFHDAPAKSPPCLCTLTDGQHLEDQG